jgi:hypothetical protein
MGCQYDRNHGLLMGAIIHMLGLIRADAEEVKEGKSWVDTNKLWKLVHKSAS